MNDGPVRPILVLMLVLLLGSCGGNAPQSNVNSNSAAATPAGPAPSPLKGFEADLQYIRNGQYTYIWVFSRKDGKPLETADSIFLRANAPQVVDWVTTDEGRKVIAGTNFNLEEGNLEVLKKRFVAEDYSNK
jgi:hypothetical protein